MSWRRKWRCGFRASRGATPCRNRCRCGCRQRKKWKGSVVQLKRKWHNSGKVWRSWWERSRLFYLLCIFYPSDLLVPVRKQILALKLFIQRVSVRKPEFYIQSVGNRLVIFKGIAQQPCDAVTLHLLFSCSKLIRNPCDILRTLADTEWLWAEDYRVLSWTQTRLWPALCSEVWHF